MSTDAFSRLRGLDRAPDASEILDDLIEFHRDRPGITERTLGACRTADGRTGYDVLADAIPDDARTVLELGCGNGPLIQRLQASPSLTRIIGVDACGPDLELARERGGNDPRLVLRCERADELAIDRGSVDVVVSHHAFYLMRPPEKVVARIAHALRSDGLFATVTVTMAPTQSYMALMNTFGALTARDRPHFTGWGDKRVFSVEGMHALFCEDPGGFIPPIHVEEHALVLREPTEALVDRLIGFFYSAHLQTPETRAELRSAWIDQLAPTEVDGVARFDFPFALLTIRRR